mmetsp:Transcript_15088/g.17727  ORF Transcript_15088/g.17727 Transcript_15088/m.17727 type:complete len:414 (+) Transcript_15088:170-1411(+)
MVNLSFSDYEGTISGLETFSDGEAAFLLLKTSDGLEGWGEFGGKDVDITLELFHRRVAPVVHGKKINDPGALIELVIRFELNYKMMGVQLSKAIAGLDSAVWDTLGKRYQKSVCELISGKCLQPYPCYASSISRKISGEKLATKLNQLRVDHGIQAFKIKIGKRMGKDEDEWEGRTEEVVKACRTTLGIDCLIGVDANGAYENVETAKNVASFLEEHKIWFFEEPFPWVDYDKYTALQKFLEEEKLDIFVAGGEQEFRLDIWKLMIIKNHNRPFLASQPDFGYCGGPTIAFTILKLSQQHGLTFMPHSPQGDLMPVMAWQMLCASNPGTCSHIELACVDDGIAQIKLDPKSGEYSTKYFQPAVQVKNGKFSLKHHDEKPIVGWGIQMNKQWLAASSQVIFSPDSDSATKRSAL